MTAKLYVPLGISVFWLVIGFIVPLFIPKGPNQGWVHDCLENEDTSSVTVKLFQMFKLSE